ncbi:hypothetical protein PN498_12280 [Oscillatoria sp. CS-180]|uniref:dioxygenase family protein n=1 Tax=Oscillatoria sp. CS-180 TaxID=3021720 RepID=UPI00232E9DA0|nr:hypothetical protein [Oscillatoria sp. CS-180]MDB9526769.1 hypothetical protein [Oscillatoria sp. CS-180]
MSHLRVHQPSRRAMLRTGSLMLTSFALATCSRNVRSALRAVNPSLRGQNLSPTPACGDEPTPSQTAGPFYLLHSPQRTSLIEPGLAGTPIILSGQVLSTRCEPIADVLLDFWHTDPQGEYDTSGYTFRGRQFTDAKGYYRLETILPGLYPGRTRHIHVRVQAPNQPAFTTQLYFPEEPLNQDDFLFQPELLVALEANGDRPQALFNFVVTG